MIVDKYSGPFCDVVDTTSNHVQPFHFIDSRTMYLGVVSDFSWWDVDGSIFARIPGTYNYKYGVVANVTFLGDFVCDAPNRNAVTFAKIADFTPS